MTIIKKITSLAEKIKQMKDLSHDIEYEIRDSNKILDEMDSGVDKSGHLIKGTINRLSTLSQSYISARTSCYLILGIVFLFWLIYYTL